MDFLNIPQRKKILITLTPAGVLTPMHDFPDGKKVKLTYILKKDDVEVTENNYESVLMCGDISPNPIEDLKLLSENVSAYCYYSRNCSTIFCNLLNRF